MQLLQKAKIKAIKRRRRSLRLLVISTISCILLMILIVYFSPGSHITFFTLSLPVLMLFYLLVFTFIAPLLTYLLRNKTHGILAGCYLVVFLLFLQNNLNHPFFLLTLTALFITLDLLFSGKKQ